MEEALERLGAQIDRASDSGDAADLLNLASQCARLRETVGTSERAVLCYFEANAHAAIRSLKSHDTNYAWSWEQPEAVATILALRQAIVEPGFKELDLVRRSQIRTNLGNELNAIGRPIEAIDQWTSVLNDVPQFAMALGNKGHGTAHYAGALYDIGHADVLLADAHAHFMKALQPDAIWEAGFDPSIADQFVAKAQQIAEHVDVAAVSRDTNFDDWPLGRTNKERAYRKWALERRLFLNPLNDIGTAAIAATDVFHLPAHSYRIDDEEPRFVRFFDLLKDEFVAARAVCFEALHGSAPDFADNKVLLFDHFDGSVYGLRAQKLKWAFRSTYSIFDKIALFLNEYFSLARPIRSVNFRNVFYSQTKRGDPPQLAPEFSGNRNWLLRGLFSLSKDLFDKDFQTVAEPAAKRLDELRNAAEHRFLSLHEYDGRAPSSQAHLRATVEELEDKTVAILKLCRAAMIYLSLAVRREESLRSDKKDKPGIKVPFVTGARPLKRRRRHWPPN